MRMDDDNYIPAHKMPQVFPRKLEGQSVAAMQEYIAELEAEITKVRTEIAQRGGIKNAAEALFKPKSS